MSRTIFYFLRHGDHGNLGMPKNALPEGVREEAELTGDSFKRLFGVDKFDRVISSPQGRCLETALCFMRGMDNITPINTDSRLGDLAMDPNFGTEARDRIKEEATKAQKDPEEYFLTSPQFTDHVRRRGHEGAQVIWEAINPDKDQKILICSHGGSRLEAIIMELLPGSYQQVPFLMERNGIARLSWDGHNWEVTYLGGPHQIQKMEADKNLR